MFRYMLFAFSGLIASYDAPGRKEEARNTAKEFLTNQPNYSLAT